jgi:two-component system, NtrC family, response regulator PilR
MNGVSVADVIEPVFAPQMRHEDGARPRKLADAACGPENIIGMSEAMNYVRRFIRRVSQTDSAVLISGESGTGKGLVAQAVHSSGKRKNGRILSIHCSALTKEHLEGELFGRDELTADGVGNGKRGIFKETDGGTILLDEIADMDMSLQSMLLGVLDNRAKMKDIISGASSPDCMVIATTNKDLDKLRRDGGFREDLFHRLNMISLRMPPLRERKEDIPLLADHFLSIFKKDFGRERIRLSHNAMEALKRYEWPGNIWGLKNLLAKICMLEEADIIEPRHMFKELQPDRGQTAFSGDTLSLGETEKNLIREALRKAGGNKRKAAKLLDISYETLRYRVKKLGFGSLQSSTKY